MLCLCPAKCANPEDYRYYLPIFMVTVAFDLVKNCSALRQGSYLSPGASHSPKGLQQQRHSPSSFVPLMVAASLAHFLKRAAAAEVYFLAALILVVSQQQL